MVIRLSQDSTFALSQQTLLLIYPLVLLSVTLDPCYTLTQCLPSYFALFSLIVQLLNSKSGCYFKVMCSRRSLWLHLIPPWPGATVRLLEPICWLSVVAVRLHGANVKIPPRILVPAPANRPESATRYTHGLATHLPNNTNHD